MRPAKTALCAPLCPGGGVNNVVQRNGGTLLGRGECGSSNSYRNSIRPPDQCDLVFSLHDAGLVDGRLELCRVDDYCHLGVSDFGD